MNARWMVALGLVALLLGTGQATANGIEVLDGMEAAVASLEDAVSAAQADGASSKGIKKASKAIDSFEKAINGLRTHDMKCFRKNFEKGIDRQSAAEDRLSPTYLPSDGSEMLVGMVRECLVTAQGIVDDEIGIGPRSAEKAEKSLEKGDKKAAKENWDGAARQYLKGIRTLEEVPIPVNGSHASIRLRALNGALLNMAIAVVPYSPKQTCGACHDYDLITAGFHFDQGKEAIRDDYAEGTPLPDFVLSDGMFGRW